MCYINDVPSSLLVTRSTPELRELCTSKEVVDTSEAHVGRILAYEIYNI